MNLRIRPDDLEQAPYRETVQTLAQQWENAELPSLEFDCSNYTRSLRTLLLTTQSVERTTAIVQAVLAQAVTLRKTADWVDEELKFEGMIEGADRADFLRFDLQQTGDVDDDLLDRYNERMNRFQ
ncbi:hypothetical protein [Spirosoma pomorum]